MEPTLWNGDWVVCHQLLRPQQVRPMHVHLILTNDSLYIKRVVHQPEHHALILLSDNEFYPPTTTPEADVLELWVADAVISKRLGSPQQTRLFQNIAQSLASIQAHLALVPPPAH
jgi:phage repressor protein C with HTH and peptisase S24 domain